MYLKLITFMIVNHTHKVIKDNTYDMRQQHATVLNFRQHYDQRSKQNYVLHATCCLVYDR